MKHIHSIEFKKGSKEELLPDFKSDFPYISTYAELDKYVGRQVPWHWHKEVELFYVEKGILEYHTPSGKIVFPSGSGGLINSNVIHMTKPEEGAKNTVQLLHIFDTSFISGQQGSLIEQKYVTPLVTAPHIEVIGLFPENPKHTQILKELYQSFQLTKNYAYEIRLRGVLSEIWYELLEISQPQCSIKGSYNKANDKLKLMLVYIHEHYSSKITISEIAATAYISERECFRVFRDGLHTTPVKYLKSYRLQKACYMLAESNEPITNISYTCGFGSSSYFGNIFRSSIGCTPAQYRNKWRDSDMFCQK